MTKEEIKEFMTDEQIKIELIEMVVFCAIVLNLEKGADISRKDVRAFRARLGRMSIEDLRNMMKYRKFKMKRDD